jgi:hypothetical protein
MSCVVRGVAALSATMLLAGCGTPRAAPPDYCKQQSRKIPNNERYVSVLLNILKSEQTYVRKFGPDGVHFLKWHRDYAHEHPETVDQDIAKEYVATFPNCCSIEAPAYLDSSRIDDEGWNYIYEISLQYEWVAEVYVWRKLPPHGDPNLEDRIGRIVSPCSDKIRYFGDLRAVLE